MNEPTFLCGMYRGYDYAHECLRNIAVRLGTRLFGVPSEDVEKRVRSIDGSRELENMVKRLLDVTSWEELLQPFEASSAVATL